MGDMGSGLSGEDPIGSCSLTVLPGKIPMMVNHKSCDCAAGHGIKLQGPLTPLTNLSPEILGFYF